MEENEIVETPPIVQVLLTPELLDHIFSYVKTPMLLKLRRVCKKWRSVTNLSLKRRLEFFAVPHQCDAVFGTNGMARTEISFAHREKRKYSSQVPIDISERVCAVSVQPRYPGLRFAIHDGRFKRFPMYPIVSVLLEQPWISKVTMLELRACLTLDQWNAVGCYILNKLSSLSTLAVRLHDGKATVLPMCLDEISMQSPDNEIKFDKLTELAVYSGRRELRTSANVCYDILSRCPNLKKYKSEITWKPSVISTQGYSVFVERIKKSAEADAVGDWICDIQSYARKLQITPTSNRMFVQDAIKLLNITQPLKKVQLSLNVNLLTSIPPTCVENVETLTLCHNSVDEAPITAVIPTLRAVSSAFKKVRKMSLKCDPGPKKACFAFATPVPSGAKFENLVVLQLDRKLASISNYHPFLDSWEVQQLHTLGPNVELLIIDFLEHERSKILKLASKFPRLKHLVLLNRRRAPSVRDFYDPYDAYDPYDDHDPYDDYDDYDNFDVTDDDEDTDDEEVEQEVMLTDTELEYIKGLNLTSLTYIIPNPRLLRQFTKVCVKACTGIDSIRKLNVCSEYHNNGGNEAVDLATLRVNIPSNLEVMTGHASLLNGKATFINMEDPDLTWEQIKGEQSF